MEEIKVINEWNHDCIILIDDARLFLSPPYEPHKPDHWPTISEIINKVEKKYIVIIYDVIIADLPDPNNISISRLYSKEF